MKHPTNNKWLGILALGVIGILGYSAMHAAKAQANKESSKSTLMKEKLTHAQNVLEGLVMRDFDKIKKEGAELKAMSMLDEWVKYFAQDSEYNHYSETFRAAVDAMSGMADKKNIEGATLRYLQVTMTCVNCHEHIRDKAK